MTTYTTVIDWPTTISNWIGWALLFVIVAASLFFIGFVIWDAWFKKRYYDWKRKKEQKVDNYYNWLNEIRNLEGFKK